MTGQSPIFDAVIHFFGLFGDKVDRGRAEDMSRRVVPVQMAAVAMMAGVLALGYTHYGIWPAVLIASSEVAFLSAVLLPKMVARPELPLVVIWLLGQTTLLAAILVAPGEQGYLWAIMAISIQFIGVIWTRKLAVAAVITTIAMVGAGALLAGGGQIAAPLELLPALIIIGVTGAAAATLRDVDYASRGNVLVDSLTGLRNRVAMQQTMASMTTEGSRGAIAVLDLDHFKEINDIHGHAVGDAVLAAAAARMQQALGTEGSLYRYGGEEFVAVMRGKSASEAEQIGDKLRLAVASAPVGGLAITLSCGVAAANRDHNLNASEVFRRADAALYRAKDEGRNRVCLAENTEQDETGSRELEPVRELRESTGAPKTLPTGGNSRWLVGSVVQRDQLIAVLEGFNSRRVRSVNILLALVGVAVAPEYGWGPAIVLALHAIALDPRARRSARMASDHTVRAEAAALYEAITSMIWIACAVALATSPALFLLPLLVVPAFQVAAAYPRRAAVVLVGVSAVLATTVAWFSAPDAVRENPLIVAMPVGLVAIIGLVGATIGRSAVDHRAAAIIDPLTGLLNRAALDLRLPEISEVAATRNTPVSVIVGDLDHFKKINDQHGHAKGDEVLAQVAERIRDIVRTADALYRVGGEEFVVLLPATQSPQAVAIAERIRAAVESAPAGDLPVTISLGVASSPGRTFRYSETFSRADAALLDAKAAGRNRVSTAAPALRLAAA